MIYLEKGKWINFSNSNDCEIEPAGVLRGRSITDCNPQEQEVSQTTQKVLRSIDELPGGYSFCMRRSAEKVLSQMGGDQDYFLIRPSSQQGFHTISFIKADANKKRKVEHCLLQLDPEGNTYTICTADGKPKAVYNSFPELIQKIEYHYGRPVESVFRIYEQENLPGWVPIDRKAAEQILLLVDEPCYLFRSSSLKEFSVLSHREGNIIKHALVKIDFSHNLAQYYEDSKKPTGTPIPIEKFLVGVKLMHGNAIQETEQGKLVLLKYGSSSPFFE